MHHELRQSHYLLLGNIPTKLKGISSSLLQSWNPAVMCPSLFKSFYSFFYWLQVGYPMGKCSLILKGSTYPLCCTCSCCEVFMQLLGCIFISTMYCTMRYPNALMPLSGCMRKRVASNVYFEEIETGFQRTFAERYKREATLRTVLVHCFYMINSNYKY